MALLNANYLGLYTFADASQTTAYRVVVDDSLALGKTNFLAAAADGDYGFIVNASDEFYADGNNPSIIQDDAGAAVNAAGDMLLMAAATSTTLDLSNTVDEVVARDGDCGSETFIVGGAQSWTLSADGLIEDVMGAGFNSGVSVMDMGRASNYVICRFALNNQEMNSNATTDETVNYIGQGIVESVSLSGGFDETQTYSVTIRGYGKLYKYQRV